MAELVVVFDSASGGMMAKLIGASLLADEAVVSGKLGAGSVISGAIAAGAIGEGHVRSGATWQAINVSGRVGIGTTTPSEALEVSGNIKVGSGGIKFNDMSLREAQYNMLQVRNAANTGWRGLTVGETGLWIYTGRFEFIANAMYMAPQDIVANYFRILAGRDGAGLREIARAQGAPDPYFATGAAQEFKFYGLGSLVFPGPGGITASGFVGIGTATPSQQLHVLSNIAVGGQVDGVDISAHTHTGGVGDAGLVTSAGIGSGLLGGVHFRNQSIISASYGTEAIAWAHIASGGVASGKIGANVVLSAAIASGQVGTPHFGPAAVEWVETLHTGSIITASPVTSAWINFSATQASIVPGVVLSGSPLYDPFARYAVSVRASVKNSGGTSSLVAIAYGYSEDLLVAIASSVLAQGAGTTLQTPWGIVSYGGPGVLQQLYIRREYSGSIDLRFAEAHVRRL